MWGNESREGTAILCSFFFRNRKFIPHPGLPRMMSEVADMAAAEKLVMICHCFL